MLKTSVVIATYNGEKFIEEQLDSILNQSYIPDEIIIFDDGSSDNTVNVINDYINKKNIGNICKLVKNEINKGYAKNFFDGIFEAKNEIVFLCDQDDIWDKEKIKDMLLIMEKNENINLLCSNLEPFYYEKDTRKWSKKSLKEMKNTEDVQIKEMNYSNFHLKRSGCTMCVRKDFFLLVKEYWVENWAHDDFLWKMAIFTNSCAIFQKVTLKRRMHSNNATVIRERTKEKRIKQLKDILEQYNSLEKFCINNNLNFKYTDILTKNNESIYKRLKVIENKKIIYWFDLLINYRNCYPRLKGVFLDLYITFFNKYKGV